MQPVLREIAWQLARDWTSSNGTSIPWGVRILKAIVGPRFSIPVGPYTRTAGVPACYPVSAVDEPKPITNLRAQLCWTSCQVVIKWNMLHWPFCHALSADSTALLQSSAKTCCLFVVEGERKGEGALVGFGERQIVPRHFWCLLAVIFWKQVSCKLQSLFVYEQPAPYSMKSKRRTIICLLPPYHFCDREAACVPGATKSGKRSLHLYCSCPRVLDAVNPSWQLAGMKS